MRLVPHQTRVLEWFSDPTRSRKAEVIASELGLSVKTVRMARSTLTALGLLRTDVAPNVTRIVGAPSSTPALKGPMIYPIVISQFSKMLGNLLAILDKAAAHAETKNFDIEVLLQARLSPDQFNLIRQIQIACDTAKLAAARLADKEQDAPAHADSETKLVEAKARLQSVIDYLQTFKAADFDGAAQRRITQPRWKGKTLSGEEFLIQHAVPNLYFHVTTAYDILRHNGVEVGKMDFLGKLPFKE